MRYVWAFTIAGVYLAIGVGVIRLLDRADDALHGLLAPAMLAAIAIVYWLERSREKRLQRWRDTGCCLKCGYDLRASPDRCPECGTIVKPQLYEDERR